MRRFDQHPLHESILTTFSYGSYIFTRSETTMTVGITKGLDSSKTLILNRVIWMAWLREGSHAVFLPVGNNLTITFPDFNRLDDVKILSSSEYDVIFKAKKKFDQMSGVVSGFSRSLYKHESVCNKIFWKSRDGEPCEDLAIRKEALIEEFFGIWVPELTRMGIPSTLVPGHFLYEDVFRVEGMD